ncbi:MAG: translation initiation factor IF-2 subunit beta [Thermoplasmataceae archaeon]|jgi:translation initiation factor 2 subunit 2
MSEFNYDDLLKKAESAFSKGDKNKMRLQVPDPDVIYEGRVTIVRNFIDIVDMINRDPKHVAKFLMKELGIGVTIDSKRLMINRKVSIDQIKDKISQYMDSFVKCYECQSPDTEIQKVGRVDLLVCKACGAQHPIRLTRESKSPELSLEEGKDYTVTVTDVGRSGEGRANFRGFRIIIPGVKAGQTLHVKIKKIMHDTAIAEVIKEK